MSVRGRELTVDGQSAGTLHRVGYLASGSGSVEPFRQGLRELGWVEGQNIVIDYRFAGGRHDRLSDLAAELVRLKVDIIVAGPTQFAVAAKNATATIPIVMWAVGDPVGPGLIVSLARPGGNVTGLSFAVDASTTVKGLELLKEAVPKGRRVAVLSNPANPSVASTMKDVTVAARSLGVQLQLVEARDPSEFKGAFAAMAKVLRSERAPSNSGQLLHKCGPPMLSRRRFAHLGGQVTFRQAAL